MKIINQYAKYLVLAFVAIIMTACGSGACATNGSNNTPIITPLPNSGGAIVEIPVNNLSIPTGSSSTSTVLNLQGGTPGLLISLSSTVTPNPANQRTSQDATNIPIYVSFVPELLVAGSVINSKVLVEVTEKLSPGTYDINIYANYQPQGQLLIGTMKIVVGDVTPVPSPTNSPTPSPEPSPTPVLSFVSVGDNGVVISSLDGESWTTQTSGTTQTLRGVAYGNNKYVAVGFSGTIITSNIDGTSWTKQTSGTKTNLFGATYGNNQYVAVGYTGTILTSPDGVTWTTQTSGTTNNLSDVTYANGQYVVVGDSGTIITSPDGTNWTAQTSSSQNSLISIIYANNQYVAVGMSGTIITSPDGTNWSTQNSGINGTYIADIAYGSNGFVAVGSLGRMTTSPNGTTWTLQPTVIDSSYGYNGIVYANGKYIAVGMTGFSTPSLIISSTDGTNWSTTANITATTYLAKIASSF
jgi:hypothetical protein